MRFTRVRHFSFALAICATVFSASAQTHWQVEQTLQIGGEGGWDNLTGDASTHRLLVPRTTHAMIIDAGSGKVLGDIPGHKKAQGVVLVPSSNRDFITDGAGSIVIFNLKSHSVLATLTTLADADGIIYDARQSRAPAVPGDGGTLMTFKPDTDAQRGNGRSC